MFEDPLENFLVAQPHCCPIFGVNNGNSYPGVKKIGKWIFKIFTLLQFWGKFHFFDFWGNGGRWGNFFLPQLIIYLG